MSERGSAETLSSRETNLYTALMACPDCLLIPLSSPDAAIAGSIRRKTQGAQCPKIPTAVSGDSASAVRDLVLALVGLGLLPAAQIDSIGDRNFLNPTSTTCDVTGQELGIPK